MKLETFLERKESEEEACARAGLSAVEGPPWRPGTKLCRCCIASVEVRWSFEEQRWLIQYPCWKCRLRLWLLVQRERLLGR